MSMPTFSLADVRRYYDRHTAAFLSRAQRGSHGAIHRAVWGPGTRTRDGAYRYVEDRIAERVRSLPPAFDASHVVDLGCGVGASLIYLASRLRIRATGVTISPMQARLANQRIAEAGLGDRVSCIEGDYCALTDDIGQADLAYAIESFVHTPAPDRFLAQCRRLVRPGGVLIMCDDFRRPTRDPEAGRFIDRFRAGWHVNTLVDRVTLAELARGHGFEHESTSDLSSYLELRRLRDRVASLVVALAQCLPVDKSRLDYLDGGGALQTCLVRGWIGYDLAVFRRMD
jgi:SAM-dependent methyltransferase